MKRLSFEYTRRLLVLFMIGNMCLLAFIKPVFAQEAHVTISLSADLLVTPNKTNFRLDLPEQTYRFKLETLDSQNQVSSYKIASITASKQGQIVFEPLSFDTTGTYYYRMSQIPDKKSPVSYDLTRYNFVITVFYNQDHQLAANVIAYKDGSKDKTDTIQFQNTYHVSSTQQTDTTKTQYSSFADTYWMLCIGAFMSLLFILIYYRRHENER